ncbi:MAG: Beta-lactamase domain protein [Parcubacteria group bacterium GW2011_GWB1_56_8]|nr:MAG: Beta-lactamase domain protein [Parcubacteria group bacterium GW2011_GWB1_56_8]
MRKPLGRTRSAAPHLFRRSEGDARKRERPEQAAHKKTERGDLAVRFVPLGGLEEVGRNCMFFESEEETPGIDYIIPNISYLEPRKSNIQAIILTHAHYDHIGALPHIVERLGNPPIYATSLTKAIIEKRQEDFPNSPKLHVQVVKSGERVKLSNYFEAHFFGVPHTIPETTGVVLGTPVGNIVHFADFRIDYDEAGNPHGLEEFERIGKMGVHTFMIDSTNAEEEGHSLSERTVEKNLEEIFRKAEGRIIVATFASLLTRIAEIIKIAEKLGRKVALSGYSMRANVQIAQNLGFIKAKQGTIVTLEEIHKYHDNKLLILSTGAQGEANASLMKIITGEHRQIKIKPGDTVALSSSVIPGNERSVQVIKDNLSRQGAIVFHSDLIDIHSSGHAPKDDLKLVMKLINPKFLVPVHGYYFMRAANAQSAHEVGIRKENVFLMDNGQVAELGKDSFRVTDEAIPAFYVMVDGLGVGDVEEVVLRDRRNLAQEGMIVVIATIDRNHGRLLKNPDIISRGFIYIKENQEIIEEIRKRIRGLIARLPRYQPTESDYVKTLIRDQIGQFLYNKTKRRPMILPVVIEI